MSRTLDFVSKLGIRTADALRHSPILRRTASALLELRAVASRDERHRLKLLCAALQLCESPADTSRLRRRLAPWLDTPEGLQTWHRLRTGWDRYQETVARDPGLTRTVLLKPPGPGGEKGLIALLFEYNWLRLFGGISDFRELDQHFDFLLCTSWSPTSYAMLALALAQTTGPLFVQVCNLHDAEAIRQFHPRLRVVPDLLGCDWIDPDAHQPLPHSARDIDFLMVANWAPFKRHWQFFHALSRMPRTLRVTLVGQPEAGYCRDSIRCLARQFGVRQELQILERLPHDEVMKLQARAKVAVIFSLREGCCVAATEALFAGAALGMLRDAHVGPVAYVNEMTGRLLDPPRLPRQLMELLEMSASLAPRDWAARHISCIQSHARLNRCVRQEAVTSGRPWTADLAVPCWRPYPRLRNRADHARLRPAMERLHTAWPKVFPATLIHEMAPHSP